MILINGGLSGRVTVVHFRWHNMHLQGSARERHPKQSAGCGTTFRDDDT